jgi:hypothetical protein
MPNPILPWDATKPADTDYRNVFPALDRQDKTTLGQILGTLTPAGAPTTAWRCVQIGNNLYLTQNARYQTNQWILDDTGIPANAVFYSPSGNAVQFMWSPAGLSPFTVWQTMGGFQVVGTGSVNYLGLIGQPSGSPPYLSSYGSDANIGLNLVTKGTGAVQVNGQPIAQTGTGYLRLGPITQQWGTVVVSNPGGDVWTAFGPITFPVAFSASASVVTMTAWNGGTPQTNLEGMCVVTNLTATTFAGWMRSGTTSGGSLVGFWLAIGPS